jgi:uncharacterized protein involved in exopolysaccharide biosynthesis
VSAAVDTSFMRGRAVQKRIAAVTFACALGSGLYAFLLPKWYSSSVTVLPAKPQSGGSGALSNLLGSGGGLAPGLFDGSLFGADAARIEAVLQSVAVTDAVIDRFDLRTRYDKKYQESTREELWRHCSTRTLPKPNLVELTCEDKDPKFVQQMLAYFAEYGNQVFRRVSVSSASEEVRFLEGRVEELRKEADVLADRMRAFQEEHKIVDLDTQAKAVVSSIATLNAQRISKQLELEYARTYSSGSEPMAKQLESQLSVVGRKLRDLEEPAPGSGSAAPQGPASSGRGMFPAALEVPKLRAEFDSLLRDRKVAEATLIYALERLEGARASAARDVSTFLVLDPPPLPTRKSRPKRVLIVGMFTLLGLVAAITYEAWRAGALRALARGRAAPPDSAPPVRDIRRG